MSDLLKEAIADAKAVRETALQNAKMALEEAFTPHLKSMLSAKLAEDEFEDEEEMGDEEEDAEEMARQYREDDDEEVPVDIGGDEEEFGEPEDDEEVEESEIIEIDGVKYAPIVSEDDEEEENPFEKDDDTEPEELDLEAVIRELEQEIAEADDADETDEEITEQDEDDKDDDDDDEDKVKTEQSTSSGIGKGTGVKAGSASDEEDPGKGKVHEQVETLQSELNEYKEAVTFLRDKLHEVNILNAKLLYTNRLFREFALSNNQKLKIVETFDRAQTTREIKLVYSTLAESYKDNGSTKRVEIREFASRKSGTTAPKKKIISEEDQVARRFQKLAGILND